MKKGSPEPSPRLAYSIEEACQMTSLSRWTLWSLAKKGKLKTTKVGRRVLIPTAELERFITEGTEVRG